MDKIDQLIKVLIDVNARIDERDDAAMDLGTYDDDRALNALLSIALNPNGEPFLMDACGESIAEIWVKRNHFDVDIFKQMSPVAQREAYSYFAGIKSEWIKKYGLDKDDFSSK